MHGEGNRKFFGCSALGKYEGHVLDTRVYCFIAGSVYLFVPWSKGH